MDRRLVALATAASAIRQAMACMDLLQSCLEPRGLSMLLRGLSESLPPADEPACKTLARVEAAVWADKSAGSSGPKGKKAPTAYKLSDDEVSRCKPIDVSCSSFLFLLIYPPPLPRKQ